MAQDKKYGHVTLEFGHVPDDHPVVVFRARDALLCPLLSEYYKRCQAAGSPQHHLDLIEQRYNEIADWQEAHKDQVQIPRSDGYHREHSGDSSAAG